MIKWEENKKKSTNHICIWKYKYIYIYRHTYIFYHCRQRWRCSAL